MITNQKWFNSSDGKPIFYNEFLPEKNKVKFVVQIVHGMAEHSDRYSDFANFLVENGAAVYADDHRGHGKTAKDDSEYGVWKNKNIWKAMVNDLKMLNDICVKNHPEVPVFILGHSMGSFLTRTLIFEYNCNIKGVILSGTGSNSTLLLKMGLAIANLQCSIYGESKKSKTLEKMSFGSFNKKYDTPYQWLTRDQKMINNYIEDPRCGGVFSCSFWRGFFKGLISINKSENADKIDKSLPIIFLSGTEDPVGNYSKGIIEAVNFYKKHGIKNIEYKLYEAARHEIINETNKKEVYRDIINWINKIMLNE